MRSAELPPDEDERVAALRALELLDTGPEERFDRITRTAARLFGMPLSFVSLIDADRNHLKSCIGMPLGDAAREVSFCAHAILAGETFVVEDTLADERFADNPAVTGPPGLRFYAGHPLADAAGRRLGTLCVADRVPRRFNAADRAQLRDLASWAETELMRGTLSGTVTELRRSEARLWAIAESVAEGIVVFGEDGRIRFANSAAASMFGYAQDELADARVAGLLDGMTWGELAPLLGAGDTGDATVIGERGVMRGRRSDETSFPMEVVVSEARVEGERVLIAVGHDLTESVRAQEAMRGSEHRFRAVFEHAGAGILLLDPHSREIAECNEAFASMIGYDAAELRGRDIASISHPDDMSVNAAMRESMRRGEVERIERDEHRFVHRDGHAVWGTLSMSVMQGAGDAPVAVGVFDDRTEERETDRIKDEFISVVGHELRTPLTSIRGSLGLIAAGVLGPLPDEAAEMMGVAVANTDRLVRLINDMLDLERMAAGRMELQTVVLPASALVEEAVRAVQATAEAAEVTLVVEADEQLLIWADGDRVVQALVNLVGNAIKFSPAGARVRVVAEREGHRALFRVCDRGRGIPRQQLETIFERFHQVDASDAREKSGTGLGLAIAREIVERHGGEIWAESEVGDGTTMSFTLRLAEGAVTLLVCGDDDHEARLVSEMVASLDCSAVRAVSPHQVAPLIRGVQPAAIVVPLVTDTATWADAVATAGLAAVGTPVIAMGPCALTGTPLGSFSRDPGGGVVVLEEDPAIGDVLTRTLSQGGAPTRVVGSEPQALEVIRHAPPGALLVDLNREEVAAGAVVDARRGLASLGETPVFAYSAIGEAGVPLEELVERVAAMSQSPTEGLV